MADPFEDGLAAQEAGRAKEAISLWETAAGAGNAEAMLRLARIFTEGAYGDGGSIEIDLPTAIQWYEKAIEAGNLEAAYDLASMHDDEMLEDSSKDTAMNLFGKAAMAGHEPSYYRAGDLREFFGMTEDMGPLIPEEP